MAYSFSSHEALFAYAQGVRQMLYQQKKSTLYDFVIYDEGSPLALVAFQKGPVLHFHLGDDGLLAYLSQKKGDELQKMLYQGEAHRFVADFTPNQHPQGFAQMMLEAAGTQDITFLYERPGRGLRQPVKEAELRLLTQLMRATLGILRRSDWPQKPTQQQEGWLYSRYKMVEGSGDTKKSGRVRLMPQHFVKLKKPLLDDFTKARMRRLPSNGKIYELLKLTLSPTSKDGVRAIKPEVYFLVDLETSSMDFAVLFVEEQETTFYFLQRFYEIYLKKGERPAHVLVTNRPLYTRLARDFKDGHMLLEWMNVSYVAQDVLDHFEEIMTDLGFYGLNL